MDDATVRLCTGAAETQRGVVYFLRRGDDALAYETRPRDDGPGYEVVIAHGGLPRSERYATLVELLVRERELLLTWWAQGWREIRRVKARRRPPRAHSPRPPARGSLPISISDLASIVRDHGFWSQLEQAAAADRPALVLRRFLERGAYPETPHAIEARAAMAADVIGLVQLVGPAEARQTLRRRVTRTSRAQPRE
jgi:hypothetical protein